MNEIPKTSSISFFQLWTATLCIWVNWKFETKNHLSFFLFSQKGKITIFFSQKILKFDCGCFSGFLFVVVGLGFWFMFYVNYVAHLYVISVTLSFADYQLVFAPLSWPTPKLITIYVQRKQNNNQILPNFWGAFLSHFVIEFCYNDFFRCSRRGHRIFISVRE